LTGFHKTASPFSSFAVDLSRFHQHCGQAFGDFFLVELSFAAAVGISPSQPGERSYGKAPEGSD
jgi:hypothetical protein